MKRRQPDRQPDDKGPPAMPEDLDGEAVLEWARITEELKLTQADRAALVRYVKHWAIAEDAARQVEKDGAVIALPNGYPSPNPWLKVLDGASKICLRCLAEMGGTPAARARIPALHPKPAAATAGGLDLDDDGD